MQKYLSLLEPILSSSQPFTLLSLRPKLLACVIESSHHDVASRLLA